MPFLSTANTKPSPMASGSGRGAGVVAPAGGGKIIPRKGWGTVKRFSVRNRYGFLNGDGTKKDVFPCQIAIKKASPRK